MQEFETFDHYDDFHDFIKKILSEGKYFIDAAQFNNGSISRSCGFVIYHKI